MLKEGTNHVAEIPFTSSSAVIADSPSLLMATHTYFPLSFFSALVICNDPFWRAKKFPSVMVSGVSSLALGEKVFRLLKDCVHNLSDSRSA